MAMEKEFQEEDFRNRLESGICSLINCIRTSKINVINQTFKFS